MFRARSRVYHALAEALAEPPDWLALPGCEWPLFECAVRLAPTSEAARRAAESLSQVRAESLAARRARYAALFAGPGGPRFWLYESAALTGRLLGAETFVVERLYRDAGLETEGAELPDHASLELAFLAHLAENVETTGPVVSTDMERNFIARHAGRWLPQLGQALSHSADEVYGPIGRLLADWLTEAKCKMQNAECGMRAEAHSPFIIQHSHLHQHASAVSFRIQKLPVIPRAESCTLCGFCAQVCPVRALAVRESDAETTLLLLPAACVGCGKCQLVCDAGALEMTQLREGSLSAGEWGALCQSPRARCRDCGQPTVSTAELAFVASRIGHPAWLDYCPDCRAHF
ncbi:MAG: molecular chaperone TorD family protein [Chloroflexi bacterium]|nr:molecular chaperone TorD family protein [Chloroflexota bacterium]